MANLIQMVVMFAVLQTVNVILQSLRTLLMAKVDCPHKNAAMNAVAFGFYVVIVAQIASVPIFITVPATIVTNIIGIYATFAIFKKARRDELWKVEIYAPNTAEYNAILEGLKAENIPLAELAPNFLTAYCYTQADSQATSALLKGTDTKHNITKVGRF